MRTKICMCFWSFFGIFVKRANFSTFPVGFMLPQLLLITFYPHPQCSKAVCHTYNHISSYFHSIFSFLSADREWVISPLLSNHSAPSSIVCDERWVACWPWRVDMHTHHVSCSAFIMDLRAPCKKRIQSAVPEPSSFIQPFRQVLGVWFAGCWVFPASACTHRHSVAQKHSAVEFPAGLPGMKCWERIWWDLLGFTLQTPVLGNTLGV